MSLLADYFTEAELAVELNRTPRTLAIWRQRREGPPWTTIGHQPLYPREGARAWLKSREVQPVRSRRA